MSSLLGSTAAIPSGCNVYTHGNGVCLNGDAIFLGLVSDLNVTLAPGVPNLAALGARKGEDLLGSGDPLLEEARANLLPDDRVGAQVMRLPLPGTPDGSGPLTSSPRGAGTGLIDLVRFQNPGLWERMVARFTHPRSASLAEREWNILCHLRHAGLSTPEPMAVVRRGSGLLGGASALVTRSLEGFAPALVVLPGLKGRQRRQALRALGLCLGKLLSSGVELPNFRATDLRLSTASPVDHDSPQDACGLEQVLAARSEPGATPVVGLSWNDLPEVALASVHGGRLRSAAMAGAARQSFLSKLERGAQQAGLSSRERRLVEAVAWRSGKS